MAWYNESRRHGLSAKGIKTALNDPIQRSMRLAENLSEKEYREKNFPPKTFDTSTEQGVKEMQEYQKQMVKAYDVVVAHQKGVYKTEIRGYDHQPNPVNKDNLINYIMEYEGGNMKTREYLYLFSYLVKTGQAWTLQGMYGREAKRLQNAGLITKDGNVDTLKADELDRKGIINLEGNIHGDEDDYSPSFPPLKNTGEGFPPDYPEE